MGEGKSILKKYLNSPVMKKFRDCYTNNQKVTKTN
jgi:hypothetical protein